MTANKLPPVLKPRNSKAWAKQSWDALKALTDDHPRWNEFRPTRVGTDWPPGCYVSLDLVTRRFDFIDRDSIAVVRLQRGAMVHLIRALRDAPEDITVGYGGTAETASYRTCALQDELYKRYLAGVGGKTAPPGESWHNRGVAADAPHTVKGANALEAHEFEVGQVPGDPSHITWRVVG